MTESVCVNYILDDEDIFVFNAAVQVFDDPDDSAGLRGVTVGGNSHKIEGNVHRRRDVPHQVGHEHDRSLQNADDNELLPLVVPGDLFSQIDDSFFNFLFRNQDV